MKNALAVMTLLFLFVACTQEDELITTGGNLPYRVWQSWEEMKEVLGDHYLYPTYLPEVAMRSERVTKTSEFNHIPRDSKSDELFYGYVVSFSDDWPNDRITISAIDCERISQPYFRYNTTLDFPILPPILAASFDGRFQDSYDRFNEHTVTIWGIDVEFVSFYAVFPFPEGQYEPDEWYKYHSGNRRVVVYEFKIDTVIYRMSWTQNNVEDKYADDEQREGMLRVAKSIIEQVREI